MRRFRCVFTILLLLLLLIDGGVEVLAMNTGFSTESLSEDDLNTFLNNINISVLVGEPKKKTIDCFSVNQNGVIAIGCSDSENKTVCIYTSDGVFQHGYSFECSGNFGIELDNDALNIYLVRSDIAFAVNPIGEVETVLKIQNTSPNNAYWNNYVFLTKRRIGDTEYALENDIGIFNAFASSYSQLTITNKNGEKSIIYDVTSTHFSNMVVVFVVVLVFIYLVVMVITRQFGKLKHST